MNEDVCKTCGTDPGTFERLKALRAEADQDGGTLPRLMHLKLFSALVQSRRRRDCKKRHSIPPEGTNQESAFAAAERVDDEDEAAAKAVRNRNSRVDQETSVESGASSRPEEQPLPARVEEKTEEVAG